MKQIRHMIIKVGSSSLVNEKDMSIDETKIRDLLSLIKRIREKGIEVLLVTSGAIAVGASKLKLEKKPKEIALKQACAALGQVTLMETYERIAGEMGFLCAQILVSHDDFERRNRMINLSSTLDALFENHVLPIINENDALAVEEIKVGDNDTLSAQFAPMIGADLLVLVSDINGLYDKNPKEFADAKLIPEVSKIDDSIYQLAGTKITSVGTGGMTTKLRAANIAMSAGCDMIIVKAEELDGIDKYFEGKFEGTIFSSNEKKISSRIHWLIFKTSPKSGVIVDDGAAKALSMHKSLLAKGIVDVSGDFLLDSVINIYTKDGVVIGKGITNYSSEEIKIIKGKNAKEIPSLLSLEQKRKDEVIHADDLVVLGDIL